MRSSFAACIVVAGCGRFGFGRPVGGDSGGDGGGDGSTPAQVTLQWGRALMVTGAATGRVTDAQPDGAGGVALAFSFQGTLDLDGNLVTASPGGDSVALGLDARGV